MNKFTLFSLKTISLLHDHKCLVLLQLTCHLQRSIISVLITFFCIVVVSHNRRKVFFLFRMMPQFLSLKVIYLHTLIYIILMKRQYQLWIVGCWKLDPKPFGICIHNSGI